MRRRTKKLNVLTSIFYFFLLDFFNKVLDSWNPFVPQLQVACVCPFAVP